MVIDKPLNLTYGIQHTAVCHTGQQWHSTHTMSRRTAATTRFTPEGIGCQKQSDGAKFLPTIRSGGPLPSKHLPDGATKAR